MSSDAVVCESDRAVGAAATTVESALADPLDASAPVTIDVATAWPPDWPSPEARGTLSLLAKPNVDDDDEVDDGSGEMIKVVGAGVEMDDDVAGRGSAGANKLGKDGGVNGRLLLLLVVMAALDRCCCGTDDTNGACRWAAGEGRAACACTGVGAAI